MRHRRTVKKLGRTASHRKAMLRNMASAIIEHRQIKTTLTKAKAAQSYIERLITYGKKDTVHARRLAFKLLQNRTLVKNLFDEIAPTFGDRNGGYTRVIKLGERKGDSAPMAMLQLVGFEKMIIDEGPKKKTKRKKASKPAAAAATASTATVVEETVEETAAEVEETVEEAADTAAEEEKKAEDKAPAEEAEAPAEEETSGDDKADDKEAEADDKAEEDSNKSEKDDENKS